MGLIFTCPECGITNPLIMAHLHDCKAVFSKLIVAEADAFAECNRLERMVAAARANNSRLQKLLTPCHPDTDAQTDPAYPATVNDVLHLLSCYWSDFLPDEIELGDEYYAAWERQARPVIERTIKCEFVPDSEKEKS